MTSLLLALLLAITPVQGRQSSQQSPQEPQKPACSSEIHWINGAQKTVLPNTSSVNLTLFTAVSLPSEVCLPAEIRLLVSYLDDAGTFICGGQIEKVVVQKPQRASSNAAAREGNTLIGNLEIRPGSLQEFVRWRNGPELQDTAPKKLMCYTLEGQVEATSVDLSRASALRIRAVVLPPFGGESSAEIEILSKE